MKFGKVLAKHFKPVCSRERPANQQFSKCLPLHCLSAAAYSIESTQAQTRIPIENFHWLRKRFAHGSYTDLLHLCGFAKPIVNAIRLGAQIQRQKEVRGKHNG
ncbi:MAG: hypothetical protein JST89_19875 [Cyanobacteria bacterium SZAS-4]|nr:hypothetical protein [Cyanobacteria bacterium SZAS-4]